MFRERRSIGERIRERISPRPVRETMTHALHRLNAQLRRIETSTGQMQARDKALYEKCVAAIKNNQPEMARLYAEECTEIRKIAKVALNSQFALERVVLRLEAVKEFGDIAHLMSPLRGVIGSVRSSLSNAMPEISLQLADVDQSLREMVGDIGGATAQSIVTSGVTTEGENILREASALAEQQVKERFPDLPSIQSTETNVKPSFGPQ